MGRPRATSREGAKVLTHTRPQRGGRRLLLHDRFATSTGRPVVGLCSSEEKTGGEGGIRTHGTLSGTPDFESGTIDHSATSPVQERKNVGRVLENGSRKSSERVCS